MKDLILKYKPFLQFLGKFLLSYLLLLLLYQGILYYSVQNKKMDFITTHVSKQSFQILNMILPESALIQGKISGNYMISINNKYAVTIIEGCNGVSVMILFAAFVIGFSRGFGKTSKFLIMGIIILYIMNILRIVILTIGIHYYPDHGNLFHEIIFPLIIYGTVLMLWLYWVKNYNYAPKNIQS